MIMRLTLQFGRPRTTQTRSPRADYLSVKRPAGTRHRFDSNDARGRRLNQVGVHMFVTDKSPAVVAAGDETYLAFGKWIVVAGASPDTMHVIVKAAFQP